MVGAAKQQLTGQFIGESVVFVLIAFVLTVIFSALMLPLFNQLAGKTISTGIFMNTQYYPVTYFLPIGNRSAGWIYPALVLSSFKPVVVLKGRFATGTKGIFLRKGLVVAQFTISIALIIATIVVYKQMNYMRNQDLGFSKDQMVVIDTHGDPAKKTFREAVAGITKCKVDSYVVKCAGRR